MTDRTAAFEPLPEKAKNRAGRSASWSGTKPLSPVWFGDCDSSRAILLVIINGRIVHGRSCRLSDGDHVALLPPAGGG